MATGARPRICTSRRSSRRRTGRRPGSPSPKSGKSSATSTARLEPFAERSQPIPPTRKEQRRASRSSGEADVPDALPPAYVARLFNDYAPRFDVHLVRNLGYRAPALIANGLSSAAPDRRFALGPRLRCGTGLMGEALRDRVDRLTGVDLAPGMIARARQRGAYDELEVGEAVGDADVWAARNLRSYRRRGCARLYRRPRAAVAAVGTALASDGLFAFSVETCAGDEFKLEPTMRFCVWPALR